MEAVERAKSMQGKPLLRQRLASLGHALRRELLRRFPLAGYCHSCYTRLELVDDRVLEMNAYGLRGLRLWQCPRCQARVSKSYVYLVDPY